MTWDVGGLTPLPSPPFVSLRTLATFVHSVPGALGELSWADGSPPVEVGACGRRVHPCHLRTAVAHAVAERCCDALSRHFGREGEPSARLVPGRMCEDLGVGIYRFTRPCQVLTVFATTLEPAVAKPTAMGAATLPAALRTGVTGRRAGAARIDLEVGLFGDHLMGVSLLWLGYPPTSGVDTPRLAFDAAVAMAGACASAEAERGG